MAYVTTTSTSWFGRMGNSAMGSLIGVILVLATIGGLFWNEGRAVKTARALAEGVGAVISIDSATVDAANDGKLVHLKGQVLAKSLAEDGQLGISAKGAISLSRVVQMFQWKETERTETEKSVGGTETTRRFYTYSKVWSKDAIKSENFKQEGHDNPSFLMKAESFTVPTVGVGNFEIAGEKLRFYGKESVILPDDAARQKLAGAIGNSIPISRIGDALHVGANPQFPAIGDLRVSFTRTDLKDVSVAGLQQASQITDWTASNGNTVFLAKAGSVSAQELFADAVSANSIMTWIIRGVALFVMFVGFSIMLSIFGVIGDIIPFVGSLVRAGTTLLALAMTILVGTLTIAASWMFYRPLLSIALVAVGLLVFFATARFAKAKRTTDPAAQPAT